MLLKSCSSKQVSALEGPEKFVRRFVEAVRFACRVCECASRDTEVAVRGHERA